MQSGISAQVIDRAWQDLVRLADGVGPRVAGSAAEREAAALIAAAFAARGLGVREQPFRWVGWEPLAAPRVEVRDGSGNWRSLRTAAMAFTDTTPSGGIRGPLAAAGVCELVPGLLEWPRYSVVQEGQPPAYIAVVPEGRARPFPRPERQLLLEPIAIVGADEFAPIAARLAAGEAIEAVVETNGRYMPGQASVNVIAELPGALPEVIVVAAHYDTVAGTPGAGDNASGVAGCLALAEHYANQPLTRTLRFIAWGAHEFGLLGSQSYVQDLAQRAILHPIVAMLALDILSDGDRLGIWAGGDIFAGEVATLAEEMSTEFPVERFPRGRGETDSWSFAERGIDTAMFLTLPYAHFHLPEDSVENTNRELFGFSVQAVHRLIEQLLARPVRDDQKWRNGE
ncbi:MAG: M28 family metallopeptidase [Thermomicrobiales bacterium]